MRCRSTLPASMRERSRRSLINSNNRSAFFLHNRQALALRFGDPLVLEQQLGVPLDRR